MKPINHKAQNKLQKITINFTIKINPPTKVTIKTTTPSISTSHLTQPTSQGRQGRPGALLLGKEMTRGSPPLRMAKLNARPGKLPTSLKLPGEKGRTREDLKLEFVGWLVSWVVDWLVGWFIDWLVSWLVDCLVD